MLRLKVNELRYRLCKLITHGFGIQEILIISTENKQVATFESNPVAERIPNVCISVSGSL